MRARAPLALLALGLAAPAGGTPAERYDVIIRGGTIIDGTGSEGVTGDVAIRGDRIVAVGRLARDAQATTVIEAKGRIVAPGFIDPHSHAGPNIATEALAPALPILTQGITTIVVNPDGGGPADLTQQIADTRAVTPGVNVIPMIGHNAVREAVMGLADRQPTPEEQAKMEGLVTAAMTSGAYGLSGGPFYIPGKYSKTGEIVGLARAAARFPHALYTAHIRDEGNYDVGVLAAVDEVITVAREARIPGIVTHMKVLGPPVWGKSAEAIAMVEKARAAGIAVWGDQYPYTASGSSLQTALVPGWAQEGGWAALAKRLGDPALRARIRAEMAPNLVRRGGANALQIRRFQPDPSLEGKRLDAIARDMGLDPLDAAIEMLKRGPAPTVSFNMSDADVEAFMKRPWMMTSTDGGLPAFGEGAEHPRSYGAFTRKLKRYVIDKPVIPMAQAIRAATGLTAQVFAIPDRGVLRAGAYADVVVFDPAKVADTATYEAPHAYSVGIEHVLVNGQLALTGGRVQPRRAGRVLLREAPAR